MFRSRKSISATASLGLWLMEAQPTKSLRDDDDIILHVHLLSSASSDRRFVEPTQWGQSADVQIDGEDGSQSAHHAANAEVHHKSSPRSQADGLVRLEGSLNMLFGHRNSPQVIHDPLTMDFDTVTSSTLANPTSPKTNSALNSPSSIKQTKTKFHASVSAQSMAVASRRALPSYTIPMKR